MASEIAKRQTLFDIGADLIELDNLLEEVGGDISDKGVEEAITKWFYEIQKNEGDKLAGYVSYIRQLEMEEDAAKQYTLYFQAKAKSRENRVKWLKSRVMDYLKATSREKVTTSGGDKICIQKNGGERPLDIKETATIDNIPERFVKTTKSINFDEIRKALTSGEKLEFATLRDAGKHIRIR